MQLTLLQHFVVENRNLGFNNSLLEPLLTQLGELKINHWLKSISFQRFDWIVTSLSQDR